MRQTRLPLFPVTSPVRRPAPRLPLAVALALLIAASLLLAACGGSRGPKTRINPPVISIQELRLQDDGQCLLRLRVQSHSNVAMRVSELNFQHLTIDGRELAPLLLSPSLDVPPYTGEPLDHTLPCAGLAATASELVYRLEGRARSEQPNSRQYPFQFRSRLLPVPGLDGVYR